MTFRSRSRSKIAQLPGESSHDFALRAASERKRNRSQKTQDTKGSTWDYSVYEDHRPPVNDSYVSESRFERGYESATQVSSEDENDVNVASNDDADGLEQIFVPEPGFLPSSIIMVMCLIALYCIWLASNGSVPYCDNDVNVNFTHGILMRM